MNDKTPTLNEVLKESSVTNAIERLQTQVADQRIMICNLIDSNRNLLNQATYQTNSIINFSNI